MKNRITAKYLVETAHPVEKAVAVLAGEQSSGTFVKVPGETAELTEKYGAKVESIEILGESITPYLNDSKPPKGVTHPYFKRQRSKSLGTMTM